MSEPRRLIDDPATSELLRDALGAARDDLPSNAELASLASRLGPLLGPGGGGAAGSTALSAKVIGALVAAAAVGGVVWWAAPSDPPATPPPARVAPHVDEPLPVPELPDGLDVPAHLPEPPPAPRRAVRDPAPRALELEVDPEAEAELIRSAQDALGASPARALELTAEHRRRFGEGTLAQEREVVAIDALVRLHRDAEARERADAFHRRWPRSAHGRRVDVLVPR